MSATAQSQTPYFRAIDGLRLIASINIALFHLERMGGFHSLGGSPAWLFAVIKGPAFHASLFFMLGGFIYSTKYGHRANTFTPRGFLLKRLQALYPLHAATTLVMVPFAVLAGLKVGSIATGKIAASLGMHLGMLWSFYPLNTFDFNTPSWALSAFLLCYLLLGPSLKIVSKLSSRRGVVSAMALTAIPLVLWSVLYLRMGSYNLSFFFHAFGPVRFFEFFLGMLLARLYFLNNTKPRSFRVKNVTLLNDVVIVAICAGVYINLRYVGSRGGGWKWVSYHVLMLPLYAALLYRMAREDGFACRFFRLKYVRLLGVCSFYPYLLHIPLASWVGWTCENVFGYRTFFHSPTNVAAFMIVLYGGSAVFRQWKRARSGQSVAPESRAANRLYGQGLSEWLRGLREGRTSP